MINEDNIEVHPVQNPHYPGVRSVVPKIVTMRAYEVYCERFSPQEDLITGECRGGFGVGELIAFLYARSFPRSEWSQRFDEALIGMTLK